MSDTASFVDPVFLDRFGLSRANVLDYFLHPLNPFRTKANTSNEVLSMQGISIGVLMAHGITGREGPMSAVAAEEEYNKALSRLTGEQYELLPPTAARPNPEDPTSTPPLTAEQLYTQYTPLHTIRHVLRTNVTTVKVLGIYYCVEGVIYKAPAVRSLMKSNVARTSLEALSNACTALASCARFHPATGYVWIFEPSSTATASDANIDEDDDGTIGQRDDENPTVLLQLARKRRKILDHRRPGERTAAEEEGIRASEAMDQILVRLSKNLSSFS
jgi:MED6 mediator sub complex component